MAYSSLFLCIILSVLLGGMLAGCDGGSSTASISTSGNNGGLEKTGAPDYLRLPLDGSVSTLDPGLVNSTDAIELSEQLFLGLTDFNPNTYQVVPELAERWERNEEGTIYAFYLRKDARWTDGTPITAHDLVWAIKRNLNPDLEAPYARTLFILKNAEAFSKGDLTDPSRIGIRAINDHTVVFILKHAASYFPALTSLWVYRPLPRHIIEKHGDEWTNPGNIQSSGSYQVKSWKKGNVLVLEKNQRYFGAQDVDINQVHYYIVPESSLGLIMYENDELDLLGGSYLRLPLEHMSRIKADPELRAELRAAPSFCTEVYVFNTQQPPMDNLLVRKALSAAINKSALINFVIKGDQEAAGTFTRPPIFGSVPIEDNVGIAFDPGQAKAWLQEAGYTEGKDLPVLTIAINESETHQKIADGLKVMLKFYLDIELKIEVLNFDSYADVLFDRQGGGYHMYRLGWCADYPDANNWLLDGFHPEKSPNFSHWKNTRFAELTEQAQYENDPTVRQALYREAEEILNVQEAVIIPLYFDTATYLVKPRVSNWYPMAFGGQRLRDWKLH